MAENPIVLSEWCALASYKYTEYTTSHSGSKSLRKQTFSLLCYIDRMIEEGGGLLISSGREIAASRVASFAVVQRVLSILMKTSCLSVGTDKGIGKKSIFRKSIRDLPSSGIAPEHFLIYRDVLACLLEKRGGNDMLLADIAFHIASVAENNRSFYLSSLYEKSGIEKLTLRKYLLSLAECDVVQCSTDYRPFLYVVNCRL